jgi:hypothetical protein
MNSLTTPVTRINSSNTSLPRAIRGLRHANIGFARSSTTSSRVRLRSGGTSIFKEADRKKLYDLQWRSYHASVLPSLISPSAPEFVQKKEAMDACVMSRYSPGIHNNIVKYSLVKDLEAKLQKVREGGGQKTFDRMRAKGKIIPRERLAIPPTRHRMTHFHQIQIESSS